MLLGCGCLIAMLIGLAPRIALIIMAIFGERLRRRLRFLDYPPVGFYLFALYDHLLRPGLESSDRRHWLGLGLGWFGCAVRHR